MTSTYKVLQIRLTDEEVKEVNKATKQGDALPEWYERYLATRFQPTEENVRAAWDLYETVGFIEAETLHEVFEVSNAGPEDNIDRVADMHSVSVGDVLINLKTYTAKYVDRYGFGLIGQVYYNQLGEKHG